MWTFDMLALFLRCLVPWTLLYLVLLGTALAGEPRAIHVEVDGIRNTQGRICASLYSRADGFLKPAQALRGACVSAGMNRPLLAFEGLPAGEYAVAVLHDENGNGNVDTNFLGIPKEGIGTSNNPKPGFGPPAFKEARFEVGETDVSLKVTVRYLF